MNGHGDVEVRKIIVGFYRAAILVLLTAIGVLAQLQFNDIRESITKATERADAAEKAAAQAVSDVNTRAAEIKGQIETVAVHVDGIDGRVDRLEDWRDGQGGAR